MESKNIGPRIKELRKKNHLSQVELAREINISQSVLSQIENNQMSVSIDLLVRACKLFKVQSEWLIHGDEAYVNLLEEHDFIPMVEREAIAGYLENPKDPELLSRLKLFKIPGFTKGDYCIFQIEGDSMVPTLSSEDQVVCSRISDITNFTDGTIMVLVTEKEALVKRIYHSKETQDVYVIKSDNEDFKTYKLEKSKIKELWLVEAKITRSFVDSSFAHVSRVDSMEKDLEEVKSQLQNLLNTFKRVQEDRDKS